MTRKHAIKDTAAPNPFDAFKLAVYRFGVVELAAELGYRPGTLYNKADADADSHAQPTLRDVVLVTRLTGDTSILDSLDRMFDRAAYDVTPNLPASDEALLELLCKVGSEQGDLFTAIHLALQNERFDKASLEKVRAEAHQLITAVLAFVQRLEGLCDE